MYLPGAGPIIQASFYLIFRDFPSGVECPGSLCCLCPVQLSETCVAVIRNYFPINPFAQQLIWNQQFAMAFFVLHAGLYVSVLVLDAPEGYGQE